MATNIALPDPIYRTIAVAIADIEGGDAFSAGMLRRCNPYSHDDIARVGWFAGWDRRNGDSYWSAVLMPESE